MKKILFAFLIAGFGASVCFAQSLDTPAASSGAAPADQSGSAVFVGKVGSVSDDSDINGGKQAISATDDKGQGVTFAIAEGAAILDKDGNPTSLDWLEENKVSIEYTSAQDGSKTAKSIKILAE